MWAGEVPTRMIEAALAARERYHPCMSQRGFPPPWTVKQAGDACFIVSDANGQKLAYVYYEEKPGQQSVQSLTKDDGRRPNKSAA